MHPFRIIPSLLIENGGLVKGRQFKNHRYVGDPINAVRIFNEKEVDEIVLLDRSARSNGINMDLVAKVCTQAFMPLAYGGGITSLEDAAMVLQTGAEKVILNTTALLQPGLVEKIAGRFGSSAVIVALDAKSGLLSDKKVWHSNATRNTGIDVLSCACKMENAGAGELLLTSVSHEGSMKGYDIDLIRKVAAATKIPVIAHGGAGTMEHFGEAIKAGASAVAAGSMCVFWGKHRAVLINYPIISNKT